MYLCIYIYICVCICIITPMYMDIYIYIHMYIPLRCQQLGCIPIQSNTHQHWMFVQVLLEPIIAITHCPQGCSLCHWVLIRFLSTRLRKHDGARLEYDPPIEKRIHNLHKLSLYIYIFHIQMLS